MLPMRLMCCNYWIRRMQASCAVSLPPWLPRLYTKGLLMTLAARFLVGIQNIWRKKVKLSKW